MLRKSSFFFLLSFVVTLTTSCGTPVPSTPIPTPSIPPGVNIIYPTEPPACTTIVAAPTPKPEDSIIFPAESAEDRVRGAENPTVTIMEYSDYADARSGLFAEEISVLP